MDCLIYPENPFKSDVVCLAIGVPFTFILLLLQTPMSKISEQLDHSSSKLYKIVWEDFVYLVTLMSLVLLWRGG